MYNCVLNKAIRSHTIIISKIVDRKIGSWRLLLCILLSFTAVIVHLLINKNISFSYIPILHIISSLAFFCLQVVKFFVQFSNFFCGLRQKKVFPVHNAFHVCGCKVVAVLPFRLLISKKKIGVWLAAYFFAFSSDRMLGKVTNDNKWEMRWEHVVSMQNF